ncbi:hypothetical protein P7C70_g1072, partial [Phenoliferia sp. Uapishka_3]
MAPTKRPRPSSSQPNTKRRKPDAANATAPSVDPAAQEASVKAYMFHAVKLLQKALKKSRTQEVQKVARKIKAAREPKEGVADAALLADLEAQLESVKALPLDHLPSHILTHRLPKLAYLRPILPAVLSSYPPPPGGAIPETDPKTPDGKARNRTIANKDVSEAWEEVSRAIAKRMGEEVEDRPVKEVAKKVIAPIKAAVVVEPVVGDEKAEVETEVVGDSKPDGLPVKRLSKRAERAAKGAAKALLPKPGMDPGRKALLAAALAIEDAEDGSEADGEEDFGDEEEGEGDDDDEVMRELARLGPAGSDSEEVSEDEGPFSGSEEDDDGAPDSGSDSDVAAVPPPKKQKRVREADPKRKPPTSSAFLPSLASGYISYSDSDGEDAKWVKDFEKGDKKERKNRRGQRARRAIWEQKYGSGAKHIVAETGGRPAPSKDSKSKPQTKKALRESAAVTHDDKAAAFDPMKAGGANAQPVLERVVRPIKIENGMHPSWEAKRRAADAKQKLEAGVKGKKITFD